MAYAADGTHQIGLFIPTESEKQFIWNYVQGGNNKPKAEDYANKTCFFSDIKATGYSDGTVWITSPPQPNVYVFEGDSISDINYHVYSWPNQFMYLDSVVAQGIHTDVALANDKARLMVGEYATQVSPHYDVNKTCYFFLLAGINDIYGELADAATVYGYLKTLWRYARSDGFKVVAFTILPTTSNKEAIVNAVNASIISDPSLYDYLVRGDIVLPDPSDLTYYSDGTHPTEAGARLLALEVSSVINGVSDSDSRIYSNTAMGSTALGLNDTGSSNTAIGLASLSKNTTGSHNTAVGNESMAANTTGDYNAAVGSLSLDKNTEGEKNTAVGVSSLYGNTTGDHNTGLGFYALAANTTGNYNTSVGSLSLQANTTGVENTAVGVSSLYANTTAGNNTGCGFYSLALNTTGNNNTALGNKALQTNTTASNNTAVGSLSLSLNTTGTKNTAVGTSALYANTTADFNTAMGYYALPVNTTGAANTAFGANALTANTTGKYNVAVGASALYANLTADNNAAVGFYSLVANTTGHENTAVGTYSLTANTTGQENTAVGNKALYTNITGKYCTGLGERALYLSTGDSNTAVGASSLYNNTGTNNVAVGTSSLYANLTGAHQVAVGWTAGLYLANGSTTDTASTTSTFLGAKTKALGASQSNQTVIGYDTIGSGSNTVTIGNDSVTGTYLKGVLHINALNTAPANAGDTGVAGEIRIASDAIYVCTATNTWKKVDIATWV